jgi:hypothetical protein
MTSATFIPLLPFVQRPCQQLSEGRSRDIFAEPNNHEILTPYGIRMFITMFTTARRTTKMDTDSSRDFTFTFVTVLHSRFIRHTVVSWHSFHVACQYLIHMKGWNVLILLATFLSERDIMKYKALLSFCVTKVYHPLPHKTWSSTRIFKLFSHS